MRRFADGFNVKFFPVFPPLEASGMNEMHKLRIVHRDIKPNNILLQILPTGEHAYKLSDFGAARQVDMEDDQFTSICGTEEYLFPDVRIFFLNQKFLLQDYTS
jgi:serine/threonine protein kinase